MPDSRSAHAETMLVKSEHLDRLLLLAGEVIVASSNQEQTYRSLQSLLEKGAAVDRDTVDSAKDLSATTAIISSDLHRLVQAIRTVSLKDVSFRARRLVRDIARKTGKQVAFEVIGEDTPVDKSIIERLYDPIAHQLRNAVDHGIEDALTRERAGKPPEGRVTLRAYNTERDTFIEIEDDGAGVDFEALRQKAIEMGRLAPDAVLTEEDGLRLMCAPGISTSNAVSQTSGRGVGMDVVFSSISELGGTVSCKTERGRGSTFTLQVPLVSAVNIVDALVVRAGKYLLAFPLNNVVASISVAREDVKTTFGRGRSVDYLGRLLTLHDLGQILDGSVTSIEGDNVPILIVEHKTTRIAFVVSEFFSPQKLVIIPFEGSVQVEGLAGSTVLGGKQLGFIADVPMLLALVDGHRSLADRESLESAGQSAQAEGASVDWSSAMDEEEGDAESVRPETASTPPPTTDLEENAESAREFLAELEKMAPDLNEAVFVLESNPGDPAQLNIAFRLFHTIKGNFIMMGLPKAGETVHAVESVLDNARSGQIAFTPEAMDVLMDGVSYVEDLVRRAKAGDWEDRPGAELIEHAGALMPKPSGDGRAAQDAAVSDIVLSHEAAYRANMHRKRQTPLYQCYIEFNAGLQPPFLVACLIYKRLCEAGDILGTSPPLQDVEDGVMEGQFKLLLASDWEPDRLEAAVTALLTRHYGAQAVNITRFK